MRRKLSEKKIRAGVMRVFGIGGCGNASGSDDNWCRWRPPALCAKRTASRIIEILIVQKWRICSAGCRRGHADWCKDARLVAAEELWRLAAEYSGQGIRTERDQC